MDGKFDGININHPSNKHDVEIGANRVGNRGSKNMYSWWVRTSKNAYSWWVRTSKDTYSWWVRKYYLFTTYSWWVLTCYRFTEYLKHLGLPIGVRLACYRRRIGFWRMVLIIIYSRVNYRIDTKRGGAVLIQWSTFRLRLIRLLY